MSDIGKIDKNLAVSQQVDISGLKFYNVLEAPFRVYGLMFPKDENDVFRRMPSDVAEKTSEGVGILHPNAAGGRVKFRTNSKRISILAKFSQIGRMGHFTLAGSAGFDLYINDVYYRSFVPPYNMEEGYCSVQDTQNEDMKEILIHFPPYSTVKSLHIGVDEGASVLAADGYKFEKPIVYYGSSITQGGCVSRPGNIYQNIICRELSCDQINLGFSGNAKGETVMAEYIASLPMLAFVMDYDFNAPSVEHLKNTHEPFFKIIREKNPDLPIVLVSRTSIPFVGEVCERFNVIKETYDNARAAGDKNVYLINGSHMMNDFAGDAGTVDGCHPNDYGFRAMANGIGGVLKEVLGL